MYTTNYIKHFKKISEYIELNKSILDLPSIYDTYLIEKGINNNILRFNDFTHKTLHEMLEELDEYDLDDATFILYGTTKQRVHLKNINQMFEYYYMIYDYVLIRFKVGSRLDTYRYYKFNFKNMRSLEKFITNKDYNDSVNEKMINESNKTITKLENEIIKLKSKISKLNSDNDKLYEILINDSSRVSKYFDKYYNLDED